MVNEFQLINLLMKTTKQERTEFWKILFPNGIYCPYIPLQVYGNTENIKPVKFKTRYDI